MFSSVAEGVFVKGAWLFSMFFCVSAGGEGPAGRERLWTNLQNYT